MKKELANSSPYPSIVFFCEIFDVIKILPINRKLFPIEVMMTFYDSDRRYYTTYNDLPIKQ